MNSSVKACPGLTCLLMMVFAELAAAGPRLEFNRDVRPILAENCFACHGPDSAARKAGLRLDRRDDAIKARAIAPGKPDQSELLSRISSDDPEEIMPPPHTKKTLTPAQKDLLKRWIAEGAEYQPHWSFIAPKRPELPGVNDEKWVRNPIDRFILAELEKRGLHPAPEADRRVLARRLSLDLIGLPPTPTEVQAFVDDRSADYYERFVDKLLASPHWGEHRGRYWLDVARYGDTHGIHFDNYREVWAYRDWVIDAFNRNLPFDQFTIEQLAGDLLPERTLDQHVASGFNRCNITTNEGGAINEEYLVLYTRDRTETTGAAWMGLTVGCAVCHDHKFDPLSQREFYELSAFFNNNNQNAMDGNISNTPPIITVPKREDRARWDALAREVDAYKQQAAARKKEVRPAFEAWLKAAKLDSAKDLTEGLVFRAPLDEGQGKQFAYTVAGKPQQLTLENGYSWVPGPGSGKAVGLQQGGTFQAADVGDFEKDRPFSVSFWFKNSKRNQTGAILSRMEAPAKQFRGWDIWLQGDRVGTHIIGAWSDDALKVVSQSPAPYNQWVHIAMSYDGSGKASGVKIYFNGQVQPLDVEADRLHGNIHTDTAFRIGQRSAGDRLTNAALYDVRLYNNGLSAADAQQLAKAAQATQILAKPADKRTPQEVAELTDWWIHANDELYRQIEGKLHALEAEQASIKARGTVAHVMNERPQPAEAFVLFRGDYDKRRERVTPATPQALPPFPKDEPRNRLGFAKWLLRPDHPLTARVTVNRFWQELFGNGIVKTSGDFGITGDLPTHPELLDYLAMEFREKGWDIKQFFKLLVTSAAYRQSPKTTAEKLEKDPQNRWLSRGPRYRMDAEMIRDCALAASGLLVPKIGGASVRPYQPPGVWEAVAMPGSNTRDYRQDKGENLYRRSMYTFWKRAAPPASMEIFNASNRETCMVRRERTNTPLQALVTLNDPQFVEAAKILAQAAVKQSDQDEARLNFMTERLLCRPMSPEEQKLIQPIFHELSSFYRQHPDEARRLLDVGEAKVDPKLDASTLAAWTMVANQLLNLDEALNK